jgi:hypothetical protein
MFPPSPGVAAFRRKREALIRCRSVQHRQKSVSALVVILVVAGTRPAHAESEHRKELRTDEAQTPEPKTDTPLKAAMQNLFLQEDPFPQQHLQLQAGLKISGLELTKDPSLGVNAGLELGLWDSWTVSARAPVSLVPADERGLGNPDFSVLYSAWVSKNENLRVSTTLRTVLPSPSRAGENAFAHDLSVIGYMRMAPLHVQVVATLDVSYGKDMRDGPRARPEGAAAAILKLHDYAFVLEVAAQREFHELKYTSALGCFIYPGSFEIGLAATLDVTKAPVTLGAIGIVSYAFDPPK